MKPLIISIEVSTSAGSVALHQAGKLVAAQAWQGPDAHNRVLLHRIDKILGDQAYQFDQVAAIAISTGPGSYTGLRVGASLAKGLCFKNNLPLIGVHTLLAMADSQLKTPRAAGVYVPLLDARRGRAYGLVVDPAGHLCTGTFTCQVALPVFEKWLCQGPVYLMGSGAENHADTLLQHTNAHLIRNVRPLARAMGSLAYRQWLQRAFLDKVLFEPLYA